MTNPAFLPNRFILSTFEAIRGDQGDFRRILQANKEAGINLVEIVFKNRELVSRILDVCEELEIHTIIQDPAFGGIGERMVETSDESVRSCVEHYSKYRYVRGYYLWDEPIEEAFLFCKETKARFERLAPADKILLFTAFPSYGVYTWDSGIYNWEKNTYTSYIDQFIHTIDPPVLCFDYYPYRDESMDLLDSDLWRDLGYLSRRARETQKQLWFYFQGVDMQTGVGNILPSKISAQMYSAIAYNAKGLSWFVTADVLTDLAGEKRAAYEELKQLNHEALCTGEFFLRKNLEKIYHTGVDADREQIWFLDSTGDSGILQSAPADCVVGEFSDPNDSGISVIAVNKHHDSNIEGEIILAGSFHAASFDKKNGVLKDLGVRQSLEVFLKPGDSAVWNFRPRGNIAKYPT